MDSKAQNDQLEQLRELIHSSVDIVQNDIRKRDEAPLDLSATSRHSLRDRYDPSVAGALRCISSGALMLRALCDPDGFLHDMMFGFHDHTALHVACQADIANLLGDRQVSTHELAMQTGINADKLSRYLRALCNMHIFREVEANVWMNNELSLLLQSEGRRALIGLCADESRLSSCKAWESLVWPEFKNSNAVNRAPFNIAYETDLSLYDYWKQIRPDLARRGNAAFTGKGLNLGQYLGLYPWNEEREGALIVDIGGGIGGATVPVLNNFPHLQLQVQDLPDSETKFHHFLKEHPNILASGRATFCGINFFEPQPVKDADIYFLRHVIHNWLDSDAVKILRNIAHAMSPSSKLLICEHIVFPTYRHKGPQGGYSVDDFYAPEPLLPNWGAGFTSRLDLQVLATLNARQRTEDEFSNLANSAGLRVTKIWRNFGDDAFVECQLA